MASQIIEPKQAQAALIERAPGLLDRIIEQQAAVASRYKPVMTTEEMIERERAIQYLVDNIMREGIDYGWIPGTKPKDEAKAGEYQAKPTLFKAGAERASAFFGYVPEFEFVAQIEEWTADKYGEMLFYYSYRCTLLKDGHAVGSGLGSATTWESKYRYRNSERTCPQCGKPNIRKSKPKPNQREEPGFYCWDKTGGCGATFRADDITIVNQEVGKMPNPDIADVVNTVQKMGQKRAYVAATLTATGLSGRFTQDLEDLPQPTPAPIATPAPVPVPAPVPKAELTFAQRVEKFQLQKDRVGDAAYYRVLGAAGYEHSNEVVKASTDQQRAIYKALMALPDEPVDMSDAYEDVAMTEAAVPEAKQ